MIITDKIIFIKDMNKQKIKEAINILEDCLGGSNQQSEKKGSVISHPGSIPGLDAHINKFTTMANSLEPEIQELVHFYLFRPVSLLRQST